MGCVGDREKPKEKENPAVNESSLISPTTQGSLIPSLTTKQTIKKDYNIVVTDNKFAVFKSLTENWEKLDEIVKKKTDFGDEMNTVQYETEDEETLS